MFKPPSVHNMNVWAKGGIQLKRLFSGSMIVSGIVMGIFFGAFTPVLLQISEPKIAFNNSGTDLVAAPTPAPGHWLKTMGDQEYKPLPPSEEKAVRPWQDRQKTPVVFTLEEAKSALNRLTDSTNVMYIWTDDDQLKVISVTCFNKPTKQAAIIVIPLITVTDNSNMVNLENKYITIQELFRLKGREGVRSFLQQKLGASIPNFIQVNQSALQKVSDIIGPLAVNGNTTTMLEAFEQTAAGIRTDDREVVRAVAAQVLRPGIIPEVPNLLYIFTRDIQTNFSAQEMIKLFYLSRQMDLKNMRKTALLGCEFEQTDLKYLFVSEQMWKNVIYNITQVTAL